jgi:L-threonylcarbamoyladenylate synthase
VVQRGGLVAYPTEAVYGLGCDPWSAEAVARLLAAKGRSTSKGLILVGADLAQLDPFVDWGALRPEQRAAIEATWPGPVTWIVPTFSDVPRWLKGGHDSVAVRVSAHPLVHDLCWCCGTALVSTSANHSGRPPARTALSAQRIFDGEIDSILHGDVGGLSRPTEIRDGCTGLVIRAG